MFRPMRRFKNELNDEEVDRILMSNTSGVLAVMGDDGYPYAIPLSYGYVGQHLYFHSANEGHKIDAIRNHEKVSFCVIDQDDVVQETFTTHYRSVIVFGKAKIITDDIEKEKALEFLVKKYSPDFIEKGGREIKDAWNQVSVIELIIEHKSGKSNN